MPQTLPAIEGWFTTGSGDSGPALIGSRCSTCATVFFPPVVAAGAFCRNPACAGEDFERIELSRHGKVWSYTDAQYQPPPPYVPTPDSYQPFGLAAVELPEGLVVLGQLADGFGVADVHVGDEVELVVEPLYVEDGVEKLIWRWKPVVGLGEEAGQ